jgi:hypothetical protein
MSFQVRGRTHDNPAEIETIYSFVSPYPADWAPMNKSMTVDEENRMPLTSGEASDEEFVAHGGPMTRGRPSTTKPKPSLLSGLACPAKIPRSAALPDPGMSAYDAIDADPKSATATPRGSSAELPMSPVTFSNGQVAGHLGRW